MLVKMLINVNPLFIDFFDVRSILQNVEKSANILLVLDIG